MRQPRTGREAVRDGEEREKEAAGVRHRKVLIAALEQAIVPVARLPRVMLHSYHINAFASQIVHN